MSTTQQDYYRNEQTDTYVFTIRGVPRPVVMAGTTVRDLVRAYSAMGQEASLNECARTFGLNRRWIAQILRALGHTHDSLPFTPEEVGERTLEELEEEARQLKQAELYRKIERQSWDRTKSDAHKWQHLQEHVLRHLEAATPGSPLRFHHRPDPSRTFCAVITPTDFHWGKLGSQSHDPYNRKVAEKRLERHTEQTLNRLSRFGTPERIIVGVGSDFFHVDNAHKTTTRGTPQDTDGNPGEMLATGCELMVRFIDTLRSVGPVDLILMSGNHDEMLGQSLCLYLAAWYRDCDDVTVCTQPNPRQYIRYGKNLLVMTHGEDVKKTNDIARLASIEAGEHWAETDHKIAFTGHLHSERIEDDRGFLRYQLPSLSGEDRWHVRHGYVGNKKMISAVLIDRVDGVIATLYSTDERPDTAPVSLLGPVTPSKRTYVEQYDLSTGHRVKLWDSVESAVREGGFHSGDLRRVLCGKRKHHKGYGFRFVRKA